VRAAQLRRRVLQIEPLAGLVRLQQQRGGVLPDRFNLALLGKPLRHQARRLCHRADDSLSDQAAGRRCVEQ